MPGRPRHILLVEDDPEDAFLIDKALRVEHPDVHVEHVTHLHAALARLTSTTVDTALLDLRLPDSEGTQSVTSLRHASRDLPVVVLTGAEDEDLALRCIRCGAQDYLVKHELSPSALRRAIGYAEARCQALAAKRRAETLEAHLAAIVETSRDAILSTSLDGRIMSWNQGAVAMFGYSPSEALGHPWDELLRPSSSDLLGRDVRRDPARAETLMVCCRKDGARLPLSVVANELRDRMGNVVGLAAIYRETPELLQDGGITLVRKHERLLARDAMMRALTARLDAVREQERTRISREVHDELGQLLTGLKMDLRWLDRHLRPSSAPPTETVLARVLEAESLVDRTISTVQRIAVELRPSALDALGLPAAIQGELRRFVERTGIDSHTDIAESPLPAPEIATTCFRVFQELLTNVARHAKAHRVSVTWGHDDGGWRLVVTDDGVGISPTAHESPSSLGLLGIRERIERLGGSMSLAPGAERGTIADVHVPDPRCGESP